MLNWSYQSAKPCSVLVGENTQFVPPSKTATSETNLSTSSRPKTSSSGGNFLAHVYSRKRRQVYNPPHAFVLSNTSTSVDFPSLSTTEHDIDREHASTPESLHDTNVTGTPLSSVTNSSTDEINFTQIQKSNITTTAPPETDDSETTTNLPTTTENYQFEGSDESHSFLDDDPDSFFSDMNLEEELEVEATDDVKPRQDPPIFSYGQDEVEIVKLNQEPLSTTMKSKTNYSISRDKNSDSKELTESNLSALPNPGIDVSLKQPANFNDPLLLHEFPNVTNPQSVTKQFEAKELPHPKIQVIEVPPVPSFGSTSSKRVLVNVTIATDPDSNNPHATQSVYVLSVSVPTDDGVNQATNSDIKHSFQKEEGDKRTTQMPINAEKHDGPWGGACECSCPSCMDEFTDTNSTDYDYRDDLVTNTTSTEASSLSDLTDTTGTSETWSTSTVCPEVTTKLPPPPTILILEGKAASKDNSLAN